MTDSTELLEPTEENQPSAKLVARNLILFFGAILAGVLIYMLPTPDGLSNTGHLFLALLVTL